MAKENLPVNFKDDILKENMNGKRRFNMIQNIDGTVSFEDVTDYTQVGSTFGAAQINATNEAVNNAADASKIIDSLETIKANTQSGYIAGALAVKALDSNLGNVNVPNGMYLAVTGGLSFTLESKGIPKEIISHLKFVDGYVGNFSGRNEDYGLSQYRHYGAIVTYKDGIVTANPSSGYVAVMGSAGGSSSGWTRFNSVCAVFQYI